MEKNGLLEYKITFECLKCREPQTIMIKSPVPLPLEQMYIGVPHPKIAKIRLSIGTKITEINIEELEEE